MAKSIFSSVTFCFLGEGDDVILQWYTKVHSNLRVSESCQENILVGPHDQHDIKVKEAYYSFRDKLKCLTSSPKAILLFCAGHFCSSFFF